MAARTSGMYGLGDEGFVHFSYASQLAGTVARYYAGVPDLVVLVVDEAGSTCAWRAGSRISTSSCPSTAWHRSCRSRKRSRQSPDPRGGVGVHLAAGHADDRPACGVQDRVALPVGLERGSCRVVAPPVDLDDEPRLRPVGVDLEALDEPVDDGARQVVLLDEAAERALEVRPRRLGLAESSRERSGRALHQRLGPDQAADLRLRERGFERVGVDD